MKLTVILLLCVNLAHNNQGQDCSDKFESCAVVDDSQCSGQNKEWMKENCARRCRFCTDFTDVCENKSPTCADIPDLCTKPEYESWARAQCRRYCGLCSAAVDVPPKPSPSSMNEKCADRRDDCYWLDDNNCFGLNEDWARKNCPKRCGFCGEFGSMCFDVISYCSKLGPDICTRESYQSWARMNCRKYCNLCAAPTTLTTTTTTAKPVFPDPLTVNKAQNGQWSYWDSWSDCSASCGGGVRSRNRSCSDPPPQNGGDDCVGVSVQSQPCNSFMCPDCSRVCPWGGTMSDDCSVCRCPNTVVFGKVKDENNMPVGDVGVYISSRQWEQLATTNALGHYTAKDICLMGTNLVFKKEQFLEATCTATMRNFTHWICDAILNQTVAPTFTMNPKDKVRMIGEDVVLCCEAEGKPEPSNYVWIKDGKQIEGGQNGELHLGNLQEAHSGVYSCRVETEAGISTSGEAMLKIHKQAEDTCDRQPEVNLIDLPVGCYFEERGEKRTRINVGACKKAQCITSELKNSGSCFDAWPRYCCDVNDTKPITVNCTRFTYMISRVNSCKCRECRSLTQISGEAYGIQNGVNIPFRYGQIHIKGKLAGETNENGYFSLVLSDEANELVLEVKNDIDRKFMDTIKTVKIIEDSQSPIQIVVPLKPKSKTFNANLGYTMTLSSEHHIPFSHVSFPSDAIITKDGRPYNGIVQASVNFMDPRNIDDIESAYGSVSTIGEDGSEIPLNTYGMVNYLLNDDSGNTLQLNSPVTFGLDTSQFNITIDENGNSEIYAWNLDMKTGKWIKSARFKVKEQHKGKRNLLATKTLEVNLPPQNNINIKETYTRLTAESKIVSYTYYYTYYVRPFYNFDVLSRRTASSTRYSTTTKYVRKYAEKDRNDACVVAVRVYQDTSFQLPSTVPVMVTAITYNSFDNKYSGKDSQYTNDKGYACLSIFCDQNVTLYAKQAQSPVDLITSNTHSLPESYARTNINRNTRVTFEAIESYYDPATKKYSPVRFYNQRSQCLNPPRDDYHFQFAPLVKPERFSPKVEKDTDNILSWYPDEKGTPERRSCFVKIVVTAKSTFPPGLRLIAESFQGEQRGGRNNSKSYGSVEVGPIPDMSVTPVNFNERAACIQFRCAGVAFDGKNLVRNLLTQVYIHTSGGICSFRPRPQNIGIYDTSFTDGVSFKASPHRNYGPIYGIYISNGPTDTARNLCFAGSTRISNTMTINSTRALGTFEC